jgi:hypothetical protein
MASSRNDDDFASLLSRAASPAAQALIDRVYDEVAAWEFQEGKRTNQRRNATAVPFRNTLERLVGDLLRARAEPGSTGRIYRTMRPEGFTDDVVSYRNFKACVDALSGLKLLDITPGKSRYFAGFGAKITITGKATRLRTTSKLMRYAKAAGVVVAEIDQHFRLEAPRHPLVLKAASVGSGARKVAGLRMDFPTDGTTERLEAQVIALNDFLSGFEIRGGIHYGFVRVFNEGNVEGFDWNRGGRLYSIGSRNYQQLSGEERAQMTINGEPVCEIDIRACNLTLLHAKLGLPFDPSSDPYARVGLDRQIVKAWVTASIGAGSPFQAWPEQLVADYRMDHGVELEDVAPARMVHDRTLETFPALSRVGEPGVTWAVLMFTESNIIIGTMRHLRHWRIPSLPVHDSLIVPLSQTALAARLLIRQFKTQVDAYPGLNTKSTLPGAREAVEMVVRGVALGGRQVTSTVSVETSQDAGATMGTPGP